MVPITTTSQALLLATTQAASWPSHTSFKTFIPHSLIKFLDKCHVHLLLNLQIEKSKENVIHPYLLYVSMSQAIKVKFDFKVAYIYFMIFLMQ
jgi:hypothetical protein